MHVNWLALAIAVAVAGTVAAKLPPPTPEEQQAAAAKKEQQQTTRELPGSAGPQGGREQSAEAHSAPAK